MKTARASVDADSPGPGLQAVSRARAGGNRCLSCYSRPLVFRCRVAGEGFSQNWFEIADYRRVDHDTLRCGEALRWALAVPDGGGSFRFDFAGKPDPSGLLTNRSGKLIRNYYG